MHRLIRVFLSMSLDISCVTSSLYVSTVYLQVICSCIMIFFCGFPACIAAIVIHSLSLRNAAAILVVMFTPFLLISACFNLYLLCHCSNALLTRNDPSISTPSNNTPSNDNRSHNRRPNTSLPTQGQRIQPQQQLQTQSWPQVQSQNGPPQYSGLMAPPIYSAHNYGCSDPAYSPNSGISSMITNAGGTVDSPPSYESVACSSDSHQVATRNQSLKCIDTKL